MARPPKIRIRESDKLEYKKLEASVKRKIRNVKKKYGIDLSGEVSLPGLENFTTRKEYNAFKEKAQSFTNRYNLTYQFVKNPYGVVKSKKEINQYERDYKKRVRNTERYNARMNNLPMFRNGEFAGTVGLRMQITKSENLLNIPNFTPFKEIRQQLSADNMFKNMHERANPEFYEKQSDNIRDTFADELEEMLGFLGVDTIDEVVEYIRNMSGQEFYEGLYLQHILLNDHIQGFEIFGSPRYLNEGDLIDPAQQVSGVSEIVKVIERYRQGQVDRDFFHIPNS